MQVHPGYSNSNLTNDVALLFTAHDDPFILGDHLDRICLPSFDDFARNSFQWDQCFATGWGKHKFGSEGEYQVVLKQVQMGLWENGECQDALRKTVVGRRFKLDPTALCAGGRGGVDTCKGDGGGPLVCPTGSNFIDNYGVSIPIYVQAGIVGWGIGCGQEGVPGVYTDVSRMMCYIDWATRCVRGEAYNAYDGDGCGRRWAARQRNNVWRAKRSWEGIQRDIGGRGKSRTVDRRVSEHERALTKWNDAIRGCQQFKYADAFTDYGDDTYNGGSDPYGDDDDYGVDVGGYQRSQKKQAANVAPKTAGSEEKDKKEEKEEDDGGDTVRFGGFKK